MDLGLLEQITRLMKENDLSAVDVRDGDKRVILKRGFSGNIVAPLAAGGSPGYGGQYVSAPNPGLPSGTPTTPQTSEDANLIAIKSPMVGTFYASSSPDAKAFVAVGASVDEETDVCIIEAMKVFNNIKAECHGTIAKIQVENGATVEFGQVLFLVKPS